MYVKTRGWKNHSVFALFTFIMHDICMYGSELDEYGAVLSYCSTSVAMHKIYWYIFAFDELTHLWHSPLPVQIKLPRLCNISYVLQRPLASGYKIFKRSTILLFWKTTIFCLKGLIFKIYLPLFFYIEQYYPTWAVFQGKWKWWEFRQSYIILLLFKVCH